MGAGNVCILDYQYWQRKFQGNPQAVGSLIRLNGNAFTIIGVAAKDFSNNSAFLAPTLYVSLTGVDFIYQGYSKEMPKRTRNGDLNFIARLRPGVTIQTAQAAVRKVLPPQ